jgi:hypothetical protein
LVGEAVGVLVKKWATGMHPPIWAAIHVGWLGSGQYHGLLFNSMPDENWE